MNLPTLKRLPRTLAAAVLAGMMLTGCVGSTPAMQPSVASVSDELPVATSCAGEVCFTYQDDGLAPPAANETIAQR